VSLPSDLLRHEVIMNLSRVPEETIVDIVFLPLATQRSTRGSEQFNGQVIHAESTYAELAQAGEPTALALTQP
jgi:hypothetical protein